LRSPLFWCFAIVSLEAIVILIGLGVGSSAIPGGDGPVFDQLARNLIFHGAFSSASSPPLLANVSRTPGYPVVIAIFDYLGFHPALMVRIAQFGMVAVTARLVYAIGREVADGLTAWVSALMTATYLPLLGLASYHLSEVTTCLLTTLVVLLMIRVTRRTSASLVSVAGLGLAIAALAYVRPEFSTLVAIVAVVLLVKGGGGVLSLRRWIRPAIIVAVFIAAVTPWTIRNADVTGKLIPFTAGSGVTLLASADQYSGLISDGFTSSDFTTYLHQLSVIGSSVPGPPGPKKDVAADAVFRRAAGKIFARLSVTTILKAIPRRLVYLWQPADFPPNEHRAFIHLLGWIQYLILIALGLIGVVTTRRTFLRNWQLWVVAVYLSVLHLIFNVEGRYSVPARPALLVFAAIGAIACWRAVAPHLGTSRARGGTATAS
jgi:4-amino-4-deoxy-L-arabinose transferase-like glycosyltransferase